MNPYVPYVRAWRDQLRASQDLPLGGCALPERPVPPVDAPMVLLFSPHPDDECITGLLPFRLMCEAGMRIVNVPVTHGSRVERQAERHRELWAACAFLGWSIAVRDPDQGIRMVDCRSGEMAGVPDVRPWDVAETVSVLTKCQPQIVFFPHAGDRNVRHQSTHELVMEALRSMPLNFQCTVVETEFWGAINDPNLMVEGNVEQVADLVAATSFHAKEVERNPYHRLLPAWMMDNVRRGSECIGGQGSAAPSFTFATLYRVSRWQSGRIEAVELPNGFLSSDTNPCPAASWS